MRGFHYALQEGWVGVVYCLSIDMIKSTEAAIKRTVQEQNRFNKYLVRQIVPHIKRLTLENAIIQFTGDGWLVMTNEEKKTPALCCLATILAKRFQDEMAEYTGFDRESISPLRIAIDSGLDMCVELPDGSKHWVGDSARKSVRAAGCSYVNEVLVDYNVLRTVLMDFEFEAIELADRKKNGLCKKMEEDLDIHTLKDIKPEIREDLEHPEWFVYTLFRIGREEEAIKLARKISDMISMKTKNNQENIEAIHVLWNNLIESLPVYEIGVEFINRMKADGLHLEPITYNLIIEKAKDYDTCKYWLEEMAKDNLIPNTFTYKEIISKVTEFETAKKLLDEMIQHHIKPSIKIYAHILNVVPNLETGLLFLKDMIDRGIQPNLNIFYRLIKKSDNYEEARKLVSEMENKGIPPNIVTYSLLKNLVTSFDDAKTLMDEMEERGIPSDLVFSS